MDYKHTYFSSDKAEDCPVVDTATGFGRSVELIPDTRLLVDDQHRVNASHSSHEIILLPQPGSNPNDLLNWSRFFNVLD